MRANRARMAVLAFIKRVDQMITNEQKEQIESLTTEEIHSEIIHYRLSQLPRDEKYDHLKSCYQQRTADNKSSSTLHDWHNSPLGRTAIGATSVYVILLINDYFGFIL